MRICDSCGTRLEGRRHHGFPRDDGALVCGRTKQQRTARYTAHNETTGELETRRSLVLVETPECGMEITT